MTARHYLTRIRHLKLTNKMDEKPFLELDLLDIDENVVPELVKLTKNAFDVELIVKLQATADGYL